MAAYAVNAQLKFSERLTPNQHRALRAAVRARGAELDWDRGIVVIPGIFIHALCTDFPLPSGMHLTRHGLTDTAPKGASVFRIELMT